MSELSKFDKFLLKGVKAAKDLYASIPKPKLQRDICDVYANKTPSVVVQNNCGQGLKLDSTQPIEINSIRATSQGATGCITVCTSGMMVWLGDEVAKQFLISTGNPTYLGKPISEIDEEQLRRYRFWHGSQDLR